LASLLAAVFVGVDMTTCKRCLIVEQWIVALDSCSSHWESAAEAEQRPLRGLYFDYQWQAVISL